jgi:hypothetical protein
MYPYVRVSNIREIDVANNIVIIWIDYENLFHYIPAKMIRD